MIVPAEKEYEEIPESLWDSVFEACNKRLKEMIKENEIHDEANKSGTGNAGIGDVVAGKERPRGYGSFADARDAGRDRS